MKNYHREMQINYKRVKSYPNETQNYHIKSRMTQNGHQMINKLTAKMEIDAKHPLPMDRQKTTTKTPKMITKRLNMTTKRRKATT